MTINDRVQQFRYYEIYNPDLIKQIQTNLNVDYFPRGNDSFLNEFVEVVKQYIRDKIR